MKTIKNSKINDYVTKGQRSKKMNITLGKFLLFFSCLLNLSTISAKASFIVNEDKCSYSFSNEINYLAPPSFQAFALEPSCTDGMPNSDAYLQISAVTDGDRVNWIAGSDYSSGDTDYANATMIGALPFQFATGLSNPSGTQDYTVRVFNGSSSSYTDVVITMNEQDCIVGCDCVENLYLNDTGFGEVHKFSVDPNDGTITEIGSPWMSGFSNPHGLGSDLNGNLYIGDDNTGPIYKVNSYGGTVANDATLWNSNIENGLTNIGSIDNYIFMNGHPNGGDGKKIFVLDACTGNELGAICLNDAGSGGWSSDWGLQVFQDGTIIATDGQGFGPDSDRALWTFEFDPSMIDNPAACVDALVVNDYLAAYYDVVGITSDGTYFYVLTRDNSSNSTLLKINATTGALVQSISEGGWNGAGYNGALGIVYAPSSGYLYVSGYEDCIAIVDPTNLSYIGPGNGTIPSGGAPKAISILKECCPSSNNISIDTFLCDSDVGEIVFLQELINCTGTICEGVWTEGSGNVGLDYNSCDNSVEIIGASGCGTFTLESDGTESTARCGAFKFQVNICIQECPSIAAIGNYVWLDENADGLQDAGEPGISGVEVALKDDSGTQIETTLTDALGGYIFDDLAAGNYTVSILSNVPSGLVPIFDEDNGTSNPDMSTSVTVTTGEHLALDFAYNYSSKADTDNPSTMTETGALGDRIWNDVNGNGIKDLGESGIANISVELYTDPDLDGTYTASGSTTTTDENGHYIFNGITPGAYVINVDAAGISSAGFNATPTSDPDADADNISNPVIIAPGDVWLGGDFGYTRMTPLADIGSTVFVDVDGDGTYDVANDLPLNGITIALVDDANSDGDWDSGEHVLATTKTASDGSYLFSDLSNGDYIVAITDVNNVTGELKNTVDPDGNNDEYSKVVISGSNELAENFGYAPVGHTSGKGLIGNFVFLDEDGGSDFDAGEPGIEGVELALLNAGDDSEIRTTKTDENGQYFFGDLDDGNYKIEVKTSTLPAGLENSFDPDGSAPADNIGAVVAIIGGAKNLTQNFGFKATTPYTISGTIWEDSNAEGTLDANELNRFENVNINLLSSSGNIISTTTTDGNGDYTFAQIPNGTYVVEVIDDKSSLFGFWHSLGSDSENDPIAVLVNNGNVTDIDFGYYKAGAAIGNLVWIDYNENNAQDIGEPGLPGAKLILEIDFNNDATTDVSVATVSKPDGSYSFNGLLFDEDYNGIDVGPDYKMIVSLPDTDMNANYIANTADQAGGNDYLDSDIHAGQVVNPIQGQQDISNLSDASTESSEAVTDFGYSLNCSNPMVQYATTDDGSDPENASQTTDYFLTIIDGDTTHTKKSQLNGCIRSWTFCEVDGWNYYYNPQDPDEYLFAIDHGANTTEIEYIEIRVDDDATNRHMSDETDATFVMVRDWFVKTKNDAALTANVNIRFYFPPAEYKQMLDAAKAQATAWGSSQPNESMVKWFKKPIFDPEADIDASNSVLSSYDITDLRKAASDVNGNNTALATLVENNTNHIQFDGITGFSGGTAMIQINKLVLPVELSSFTGKVDRCNTALEWTAETEENFSHYEIQWSGDGKTFKNIASVKGRSFSSISQTYNYVHATALQQNYYRMKLVDLDETYEYSKTIFVETNCEDAKVTIYPNPIGKDDDILNIDCKLNREDIEIEISNMLGIVIKRLTLDIEPNVMNTLQIETYDLPSGSYSLKINGERRARIFTKQ